MDLLENPFYLLEATVHDDRRRLVELAEERSLLLDPEECTEARSNLSNPRKRLSAELAWLPGIEPEKVNEYTEKLNTVDEGRARTSSLLPISHEIDDPLARANWLASTIKRLSHCTDAVVVDLILQLANAYEEIDGEEVADLINADRQIAHFPEEKDLSVIESELKERRLYFRQAIKTALNKLPSNDLVRILTEVVNSSTNGGSDPGLLVINDIVDAYEVEAQRFFEKESQLIERILEAIRKNAEHGILDARFNRQLNALTLVVNNWVLVAKPLQFCAKSKGIDHSPSVDLADKIRDVAIELFNKHTKLAASKEINLLIKSAFSTVSSIVAQAEQDADTLNDIERKRERQNKRQSELEKEVESELYYEVQLGWIFKKTLKITAEGIYWDGSFWKAEDITVVRWGDMRDRTGVSYKINFATPSNWGTVDTDSGTVYSEVVQRLIKLVVLRLLMELILKIKAGRRIEFGDMTVFNEGITFSGLFSSKTASWRDIKMWVDSGSLCVKPNGSLMCSKLSYLEDDNTHVLEGLIKLMLEKGYSRVSDLDL